jgi:hypothetical protein
VHPPGQRPLVQVGERPRVQGLALQLRALEGAEHHHLGGGAGVLDEPGRVQAVEDGHAQVDDDDVGLVQPGQGDRVGPVAALAHDLEPGLGEQVAQGLAEPVVVVGQQHPGPRRQAPHGRGAGIRASTRSVMAFSPNPSRCPPALSTRLPRPSPAASETEG